MSRNDAAGLDRAKVRSTSIASRTVVIPNTTAYKADRVELREMSGNVSSGALFDGTRRCWRHRATIRGSRRITFAVDETLGLLLGQSQHIALAEQQPTARDR
jgi:hypothetical protein